MARHRWIEVALVLACAAAARAEDPPAAPRHQNKISEKVTAASGRLKSLVYRPEDHGLESVTGEIVAFGLKSRERLEFDFTLPRFVDVTIPAAVDREMRKSGIWVWTVKEALYLAFDAWGLVDFDEADADIVVKDGATIIAAANFDADTPTSTDEFVLDDSGLVTRRIHRAVAGSKATSYTAKFAWTRVGGLNCVSAVEIALDEAKPTKYEIELHYADAGGVHLVTSYEITFLAKDAAPKTFAFHVDGLVVNGKEVDLPTPWKHENKVSPEAEAAIERLRGLVARPADRGLKSFMGEVMPIGFQSRARTMLAFTTPGAERITVPPVLEEEASRARIDTQIVTVPLYLALDPAEMLEFDECDVDVADCDGSPAIVVTEFEDGKAVRQRDYVLDPAGLIVRQRSRTTVGDNSEDFTKTYTWSKAGDRYRITGVENVFEDSEPASYSCTIEYSDVGGFQLPVSWSTTYATGPRSMRSFRFYVDNALVNGAKVELPRPWIHESRVSPEAKAMIDRCAELVDRPADHGFASATFDLVTAGTKTPISASYEVTAPANVVLKSKAGASWGGSDPRSQRLVLEVAFDPLEAFALRRFESTDADVVERDGRRVLVLTSFRDGAKAMEFDIQFGDDGLPVSVTTHDVGDSGDPSQTATMRLTWTASGERRRVEKFGMTAKVNGATIDAGFVLRRAPMAGMDLVSSIDVVLSSVATGPLKSALRVENLVVNGTKADVPAAPAHVNHVTAEAQAAIDRFAALVYRPADHGLKTVSGELVPGAGTVPLRHKFAVATPQFVSVTIANGLDQDSPAGRVTTAEMTAPLRMAYGTFALVGDAEFDAGRVTKDGRDVVTATCYRDGVETQDQELTLDEEGLIRTARVRTVGESGATAALAETTFTWARIGDRWRVTGLDTVSLSPADAGKWLLRVGTTFRYADVGGVPVLAAFSVCQAVPGKTGTIYTLHTEHLVLNGKPVDLPRPVHANVVSEEAKTAIERFEKLVYRAADHGLASASGVFQPLGLTFEVKPPARAAMTLPPGEKPGSPRAGMQTAVAGPLASAFGGPLVHASDAYDAAFADRGGARVLVVTEFRDDLPIETREISFDADGLVSSATAANAGPSPVSNSTRYTWTDSGAGRLVASEEVWDPSDAKSPHMTVALAYSDLGGVRVPTSITVSFAGGTADGKSVGFRLSEMLVNGRKFVAEAAPTGDAGKR